MGFPVRHWLKSQFSELPVPSQSFAGQTVVITGGNVGLGKEAARHIVRLGVDKLVFGVRNVEAGKAAKADVEASTGRAGVCEVWHVDLASYDSVKAFATRASKELPRVDVLLNNAAHMTHRFHLINGHESQITVNVISTFLLSLLFLPKLRETARKYGVTPRISVVSSEAHLLTLLPQRNAESIFEALDDEPGLDMQDQYNVSKLLEILVVRQIAPLMAASDSGVVLNLLNPGLCKSQLARDMHGLFGFSFNLLTQTCGRTTEMGSRCLVAAAAGDVSTHGQYMNDCKVDAPAPYVLTDEYARAGQKIWVELEGILEGIEPGVTRNLT